MKDYAETIEISIGDALIKQGNLRHTTRRFKTRDEIYREINTNAFIDNLKVGLQVKEGVKAMLPATVIRLTKRTSENIWGGVRCKKEITALALAVTEMAVAA
jgi:hypothetical protein